MSLLRRRGEPVQVPLRRIRNHAAIGRAEPPPPGHSALRLEREKREHRELGILLAHAPSTTDNNQAAFCSAVIPAHAGLSRSVLRNETSWRFTTTNDSIVTGAPSTRIVLPLSCSAIGV